VSKTKRTPIDYKPQFSDAIFRPKEVVESEAAVLEEESVSSTTAQPQAQKQVSTKERIIEPTNIRTNERRKVRHSFDIYEDQLLTLTEIQTSIFRATGKKPKLGELVQQAIDEYIRATKDRPNERTNG
jgi:hypothetical protein